MNTNIGDKKIKAEQNMNKEIKDIYIKGGF